MDLFYEYLRVFGWGIIGAVTMAVALPILLKVFDWFTPVNEWEEVRNGNMSVAIIIAALIIGFAIVMGFTLSPSL